MTLSEAARLLLGLKELGWTDREIMDFALYMDTGEEQYQPKPDKN